MFFVVPNVSNSFLQIGLKKSFHLSPPPESIEWTGKHSPGINDKLPAMTPSYRNKRLICGIKVISMSAKMKAMIKGIALMPTFIT